MGELSGRNHGPPGVVITLTACVAAGFGMLGWLGAQLLTLVVLGHRHTDGAGHGYRHLHGFVAPLAVSVLCLVAAALCALWLLPSGPPASEATRAGSRLAVTLPVAAFAALELGTALTTGARPSDTLTVLLLGGGAQAGLAFAAQLLTRATVSIVTGPQSPELPVIEARPRFVPPDSRTSGRSRLFAVSTAPRAPPLSAGT